MLATDETALFLRISTYDRNFVLYRGGGGVKRGLILKRLGVKLFPIAMLQIGQLGGLIMSGIKEK